MYPLQDLPLTLWLAFWRAQQLYHRYSVEGLHHLDGPAAMIVGYHRRPIAYDMCMLTVALYDRLGYMPHGMVYRWVDNMPLVRDWLTGGLGFVTGDNEQLAAAVDRGEHIMITPGGV